MLTAPAPGRAVHVDQDLATLDEGAERGPGRSVPSRPPPWRSSLWRASTRRSRRSHARPAPAARGGPCPWNGNAQARAGRCGPPSCRPPELAFLLGDEDLLPSRLSKPHHGGSNVLQGEEAQAEEGGRLDAENGVEPGYYLREQPAAGTMGLGLVVVVGARSRCWASAAATLWGRRHDFPAFAARAFADATAIRRKWAFRACSARRARTSGCNLPSGSTSFSKLSRKACRAGAVLVSPLLCIKRALARALSDLIE